MPRLTAVSIRPYRMHQLEIRDGGGNDQRVIIHPPHGRSPSHEVTPTPEDDTLVGLINRAKAMIDQVMGPLPAPSARSGPRRPR